MVLLPLRSFRDRRKTMDSFRSSLAKRHHFTISFRLFPSNSLYDPLYTLIYVTVRSTFTMVRNWPSWPAEPTNWLSISWQWPVLLWGMGAWEEPTPLCLGIQLAFAPPEPFLSSAWTRLGVPYLPLGLDWVFITFTNLAYMDSPKPSQLYRKYSRGGIRSSRTPYLVSLVGNTLPTTVSQT